jgi:hypothetical protein
VNGHLVVDEYYQPLYPFFQVARFLMDTASSSSEVNLTFATLIQSRSLELDAYLQRVLWEDDNFVRAVDAIHQGKD